MSENTPMRRRRPPQPVQIDDASIPHKSDEDNPVRPAREMPPHRRVRVVPIETTDDDAPRHLPESPLSSLPTPVRFGALALALILLIVGSVSITRTYLAHQEERRRLEAEAAERAQHPAQRAQGQAHDGEIIALDPADEHGPVALNAVASGLVHRLAGPDIGAKLLLAERAERHLRHDGFGLKL